MACFRSASISSCADLTQAFSCRSWVLRAHDLERALARLEVIREEARFWGRSFQGRLEVLRPFSAWRWIAGSDLGLRMSPVRCELGSVMGSSRRGMIYVFC